MKSSDVSTLISNAWFMLSVISHEKNTALAALVMGFMWIALAVLQDFREFRRTTNNVY
jgi:hypothetical protein